MTLQGFVTRAKIRATAEWAERNPHMNDMPAGSSHWKVTLRRPGRQMTVPFSQGPAHCREPEADDVLSCLLSDASSDQQDFASWCADLGYDEDSRKAERTYQAVQQQTAKLQRFLGDLYDEAMRTEY